jgi:membrane dipeptidase
MFVGSRANDVLEAKAQGKIALFPSLETATCIANDLDKVDVLYGLGIRCMGLTFNSKNAIGDGSNERNPAGLSKFGLKAIERMNRVGMLIDVAHASTETTIEAIDASEHPVICSHNLADLPRSNPLKKKTDDVASRLADKGGVVAIQAVPNITTTGPHQKLEDVLDNIQHLCDVVGVDYVAVGLDRFFGDHVAFDMVLEEYGEPTTTDYEASTIEGLEDPGQWPNIVRGLILRGFSDEDIKKVVGLNAMRVLKAVIG